MKRSLKVLKRNLKKCAKAEGWCEEWTEYTKELMKKIPIGKCMEAEDKCNSMIRTMEENQAWQDMWCGNQIPSRWYE